MHYIAIFDIGISSALHCTLLEAPGIRACLACHAGSCARGAFQGWEAATCHRKKTCRESLRKVQICWDMFKYDQIRSSSLRQYTSYLLLKKRQKFVAFLLQARIELTSLVQEEWMEVFNSNRNHRITFSADLADLTLKPSASWVCNLEDGRSIGISYQDLLAAPFPEPSTRIKQGHSCWMVSVGVNRAFWIILMHFVSTRFQCFWYFSGGYTCCQGRNWAGT